MGLLFVDQDGKDKDQMDTNAYYNWYMDQKVMDKNHLEKKKLLTIWIVD